MELIAKINELFDADYIKSKEDLLAKIALTKELTVKIEGFKRYVNGIELPNNFPATYFMNFIRPTSECTIFEDGEYIVGDNGFLPKESVPSKIELSYSSDGDSIGQEFVPVENYKQYHSFIFGI